MLVLHLPTSRDFSVTEAELACSVNLNSINTISGNMKKLFCVLCTITCAVSFSSAQTLSPAVLSSAGGIGKTDNVSVEWTLGQSAVETAVTNDNIITQGFHQGDLRIVDIETPNETLASSFHISVAPNPVQSVLTVRLQSDNDSKLLLNLSDMNGQHLLGVEASSTDTQDIDMSTLSQGYYILSVKTKQGDVVKTYKISKIQ